MGVSQNQKPKALVPKGKHSLSTGNTSLSTPASTLEDWVVPYSSFLDGIPFGDSELFVQLFKN